MAEDTRELVIAEARRLFFLYGFRRITMDEIATNLRMSKKTLYGLFPSKEEVMRAVVFSIMVPKMAQIQGLMQETTTIADFFCGIIKVFRGLSHEISEPMMTDIRMMPELWKEIEERRLAVLSRIKEVVERGKQTGEVRQNLNVDLFLRVFMQIVNCIGNPTMMLELNLKPSELAEQIFSLFFYGIVPTERSTGGVS